MELSNQLKLSNYHDSTEPGPRLVPGSLFNALVSREFTRGVARGIDRDVGSDLALMRSGIRRFGSQFVDLASIVTKMYARDLEPGIIDVKVISSRIVIATVSDSSLSFDESTLADARHVSILCLTLDENHSRLHGFLRLHIQKRDYNETHSGGHNRRAINRDMFANLRFMPVMLPYLLHQ